MAPRAAATRGRPKRAAAPSAVDELPKKRGRTTKAATPAEPTALSKKRGRAAKVEIAVSEPDEPDAPAQPIVAPKTPGRGGRPRKEPAVEAAKPSEEDPVPKKRSGRPRKEPTVAAVTAIEADAAPKKRGRPRKSDAPTKEAPPAMPKRAGRPPRKAVADLDRVAGSARVSKRIPRKAATAPAAAPASSSRIDPRVRSRLRNRVPVLKKATPVAEETKPKRRGRAKKTAAHVPEKKTVERKTKAGRVAKAPTKPRKRRGYTQLDIPDRFVRQVDDFLQGLIKAEQQATADDTEGDQAEMEDAQASAVEAQTLELEGVEMEGDVDGGAQESLVNGQKHSDASEQQEPAEAENRDVEVDTEEHAKEHVEIEEEIEVEIQEEIQDQLEDEIEDEMEAEMEEEMQANIGQDVQGDIQVTNPVVEENSVEAAVDDEDHDTFNEAVTAKDLDDSLFNDSTGLNLSSVGNATVAAVPAAVSPSFA